MKNADSFQKPHYSVELVKASDPNGELFYAYLLLPETMVDIFHKKLTENDIELEKYGVVLASGKGHTPSREHVDYINMRFSK